VEQAWSLEDHLDCLYGSSRRRWIGLRRSVAAREAMKREKVFEREVRKRGDTRMVLVFGLRA
jgi:hypothetical protein